MLAHYSHHVNLDADLEALVRKCLIAPLKFDPATYPVFALSFLSQPDLVFLERDTGAFAAEIDVDRLAEAIASGVSTQRGKTNPEKDMLWLLAHYIAIRRASKRGDGMTASIRVLYTLLSRVSTRVRNGLGRPSSAADAPARKSKASSSDLTPYVAEQVKSLADAEGISDLSAMVASYVPPLSPFLPRHACVFFLA